MGCSAAKNLNIELLEDNKANENRKISISNKSISDLPLLESEEPQTEILKSEVNNLQKGSNGLSFEIAFQENNDESIIKKHPPRRLQRLEEQQSQPSITLEMLQEKLDDAEVRRQQFLQQRKSSKYRSVFQQASFHKNENDDNTFF